VNKTFGSCDLNLDFMEYEQKKEYFGVVDSNFKGDEPKN
jgi:hypothetical protein